MSLKNAKILVIDDDLDVLAAVRILLKTELKEVVTEKNPENIRQHLAKENFDFILLDMNFNSTIHTGNEGLYLLKKIKESGSLAHVIMITAYGDIDLAVRSLKEGATDFMIKPWHNEKLIATLREIYQKKNGLKNSTIKKDSVVNSIAGLNILGVSEAMKDIFIKIEKVAGTDANILILGENGTGKDLIANAIQKNSTRKNKPYLKVDAGALTESLFESELFGYKKGAFTGANEDRIGRFESANNGTIFLDEIGNISLQQQSKLLSVLQNRQVIKIGSNIPVDIDIRLICATNMPVSELANEKRFRRDLIYRINTVEIVLPPLRNRKEDIELLSMHFLELYASKYNKPKVGIEKKGIEKLIGYHFPGNVRELQYTIGRAVIMSESDILKAEDLIFSSIENNITNQDNITDLKLVNIEKNTIINAIDKYQGNISKAAKELGITRTALYRRLSKYDI